jgi:lysozyme|tara:strand:+ start:2869 stop:3288 length:420 start_codon:yes stop_codon:yes gene_type:complete
MSKMATLNAETANIMSEEGFEPTAYLDSMGVGTIGHGLTWMTEDESSNIIYARAPQSLEDLTNAQPMLLDKPDEVSMITYHMAYQMGLQGTLNFKKMWAAIEIDDYVTAAAEMINSRWAMQTPARANRLADRMRACTNP